MNIIILIICCSILLAGGFLIAFLVSVKKGAMDDEYAESVKILFENDNKQNNL
jgi:cbb3-type cytochrome oxidase maturation protein